MIKEQVQAGKVVRFHCRNYVVKIWRRGDGVYFVSYRWRTNGKTVVEYYEYYRVNDAVREFEGAIL